MLISLSPTAPFLYRPQTLLLFLYLYFLSFLTHSFFNLVFISLSSFFDLFRIISFILCSVIFTFYFLDLFLTHSSFYFPLASYFSLLFYVFHCYLSVFISLPYHFFMSYITILLFFLFFLCYIYF
jgi:hypothetical protein